jgi:flagellar protein FlgJ
MMDTAAIYTDFTGLTELKARAGQDADGSLDEVARQFESLLLGQMLKSMRQASLGEGLMESEQSLFYRDMYDKQLALHLAKSGGLGLAEMIKRQIGGADEPGPGSPRDVNDYRQQPILGVTPSTPAVAAAPAKTGPEIPATAPVAPIPDAGAEETANWQPEDFVERLWPWAREAAQKLGLAPQAILAQAALESGWGRRMMQMLDGSSTNNLFGIKADRRWEGEKVSVDTLEYEQGLPSRKKAYFRAYESHRESFNDYVAFLRSSPRYREALEATSDPARYFSALQKAGYATDPRYAAKIDAVLNGPQMQRALERLKVTATQPL